MLRTFSIRLLGSQFREPEQIEDGNGVAGWLGARLKNETVGVLRGTVGIAVLGAWLVARAFGKQRCVQIRNQLWITGAQSGQHRISS